MGMMGSGGEGVAGFLFLEKKEKLEKWGLGYDKARVFPFSADQQLLFLHSFIRRKESRNYGLPQVNILDMFFFAKMESFIKSWTYLAIKHFTC